MNKTKIIATITDRYTKSQLIDIYHAGVNILRFNFSHAQQATTQPIIDLIHQLNSSWKTNFGLLLDTKWPEVRTGERSEPYTYRKGETFRIFTSYDLMDQPSDLFCDYPSILKEIKVWKHIAIESWLLDVSVLKITKTHLIVKSNSTCEIGSRRHMNFPWLSLSLPAFTDKDKSDLKFAVQNGFHFIAVSFVRNAKNLQEIRSFLAKQSSKLNNSLKLSDKILWNSSPNSPSLVAKIENKEWIDNIQEIVRVSDGIMIARGDLGIEIPITELPFEQTRLINICRQYGKPCIMATELLKSMTTNPLPTRAEVSDVYNSVIAWVDATMLSDETAIWKFPVQTVKIMRETISEAETHLINPHTDIDILKTDEISVGKKYLVKHALMLADELQIENIILFTHSGNLAQMIAGYKPNQAVFAFSTEQSTIDKMHLFYAIQGIKLDKFQPHTTENQDLAIKTLLKLKKIKKGEKILIVADKNRGTKRDPLIRITIA